MTKWRDCVTDPSEIGKKVLCIRRGDVYVAIRFEEYYVPMPFADHYFSTDLCKPEKWCEIDFPEPYTGYIRVMPEGINGRVIKMSEARELNLESYWEFARKLIDSIGKIPFPDY